MEYDYEFLDPREVAEVNKQKGDLLKKAMEARNTADTMLKLWKVIFRKQIMPLREISDFNSVIRKNSI